jgi:hypothetical protein
MSSGVFVSYVTPSGRLYRQHVHLPAPPSTLPLLSASDPAQASSARTSMDISSPVSTGSGTGGSRLHLPVPKHLRALAARSVERLPLIGAGKDGGADAVIPDKVKQEDVLGEVEDLGPVEDEARKVDDGDVLDAVLSGFGEVVQGVLRKSSGVVVSCAPFSFPRFQADSVQILNVSNDTPSKITSEFMSIPEVEDVRWVQRDAFSLESKVRSSTYAPRDCDQLRFQGRADVYTFDCVPQLRYEFNLLYSIS